MYEVETGRLREVDTSQLEAREKELVLRERKRLAEEDGDKKKGACGCGEKH